ncbi:MAG: hypothetical protein GQ474_00675 [Sulfurimonas sp.]|nr:hypothetical protein [Sulfurimonas sp.]
MIVSHKKKFIFIKTNKTAGTSIEIMLSEHCGDEDIITQISKKDEIIRQNLGFRGPQNSDIPLSKYKIADFLNIFKLKKKSFYNHMSSAEIIENIGLDKWNEYYKFTFERHPVDRFLSFYFWHNGKNSKVSISQFLKSDKIKLLKKRGRDLYMNEDKVLVDKIYKYEELESSMQDIKDKLNILGELNLPVTKSGTRDKKKNYKDLLTNEEILMIENEFNFEMNLMNYKSLTSD